MKHTMDFTTRLTIDTEVWDGDYGVVEHEIEEALAVTKRAMHNWAEPLTVSIDVVERELSGHFYIDLTEDEIREAGGSYGQAVQNAVGHTGMTVSDVQDNDDATELAS